MAGTVVQAVPTEETVVQPWPLSSRILFRFFCCYWLLYALPDGARKSVLDRIPGNQLLIQMWRVVVPWVAIHVFHVTGRAANYVLTTGEDGTLKYIYNLLCVVLSLVATLIWSILDRRRPDYCTLHDWLRILVRYTLAVALFGYGFAKIFPVQFHPPGLSLLVEPYGDFSPMGALWWFMGASIPYTIFTGAAEVAAGLLLLFRRTTSLGAMVSCAVMANVVALNFCYDVPAKLYSSNLLLMAVFLLVPDLRRLFSVLVLNCAAAPSNLVGPRFSRRWMRTASTAFWVLFVGFNLAANVAGGWKMYKQMYLNPARAPLYGLYDVENGYSNWRKVAIEFPSALTVRANDDSMRDYSTTYGDDTVTLNGEEILHWSRPDANHVLLEGDGKSIRLRQIDVSKFPLLGSGFHWITENLLDR
ncbi:MAG: hypothetical protein JO307_26530 [Bryobacterales bacterium]|nr:hypothetical protein [Bryobacterales bacterium]MBV9400840.1 hypothetical protein [Bryobacterales bacterium]